MKYKIFLVYFITLLISSNLRVSYAKAEPVVFNIVSRASYLKASGDSFGFPLSEQTAGSLNTSLSGTISADVVTSLRGGGRAGLDRKTTIKINSVGTLITANTTSAYSITGGTDRGKFIPGSTFFKLYIAESSNYGALINFGFFSPGYSAIRNFKFNALHPAVLEVNSIGDFANTSLRLQTTGGSMDMYLGEQLMEEGEFPTPIYGNITLSGKSANNLKPTANLTTTSSMQMLRIPIKFTIPYNNLSSIYLDDVGLSYLTFEGEMTAVRNLPVYYNPYLYSGGY